MQPATATVEELPIRTVRPKAAQPIRLDIPNQQRLTEGTMALARAFGAETEPTLILNQFVEEAFPAWLEGKLALARLALARPEPPKAPRPARRPKEVDKP